MNIGVSDFSAEPLETRVMSFLFRDGQQERTIGAVVQFTKAPLSEVNEVLTRMEIRREVQRVSEDGFRYIGPVSSR
ncbi:MAG: hypothetical protein M3Q73_01930, partial [bacterium]|nr:hypothetical protein [bacterium]